MNEVTLPPSPNWYLSNILSCAEDGTAVWGARNSIVVARPQGDGKIVKYSLIGNAHPDRVTALSLSPEFGKSGKNLVASGGDEHIVRIWDLDTLSAVSSQAYMDTKQKVIGVDWSKCNPDLVCFVSSDGLLMSWIVSYNACQQYSLGKLTATCLACSPHDSNIVAVGTKNGLVYIVNVQGNGSINYKLRGHDVEITSLSWCPTDINILNDSRSRDLLLASGAKDRSVFIWRAGGDGRYQLEISVPQKPLDSNQHRAKLGSSAGNWTAVCWAEPKRLLASSSWGELISWDFTMGAKSKPTGKLVHANHTRGLFCIAKVPSKSGVEEENWRESKPLIVWTLAQDRQVIRSSITAGECKTEYSVPTQGGYVYCMAACPLDTSRIAFGVGDAMLRLWNLSEPHETSFDVSALWQKIMGKVRSIAWHPEKENLLAFGTAEGRVGVWDTNTTKPPLLYCHYHRHTVYSLGWGPNPNDKNPALYSCGDGELVYYVPEKATKETKCVIKKDCTEFAWKPDNSCMALGYEDGSISFLNRELKEVGQPIYALKKSVQCLAWHPDSTATDLNLSPLRNYLAAAINASTITIFDLSDLMDGIDNAKVKINEEATADSTVTQHKVAATLCGHVEKVVALAWSSHFSGHLVSGSYDYTAQVWKVETQELIATYAGHTAPVQSCMWSPLDPDYIITGSSDFTIRVWKVSEQKVVMPTERPHAKRVRTKKNNKNRKSAKSLTSETHEETIASPSSQESSFTERMAACKIEESSKEIVAQKLKKDRPKKVSYLSAYSRRMNDKSNYTKSLRDLMKYVDAQKTLRNGTNGDVNGESEKSFSIFGSPEDISMILEEENSSHLAQGQYNMTTEMSLWNNSLRKNLQEATKEKRLNDYLVSLSSSLSMKTWHETCEAYATQLMFESNPTKAVSYLLCIHKIHRAVEVFVEQKMYREAYVLARCKLDPEDEIFRKILEDWAASAAREGNFEDAASCYAKLGDFARAAKFLGRRRDVESLEVAAEMGFLCDESGLGESLADQALVAALMNNDSARARGLMEKFPQLQHREVQVVVFEELKKALEDDGGASRTTEWLKAGTDYGFLETMRAKCEKLSTFYGRLSQNPNISTPETEAMLWLTVSHHLAIAVIAPTLEKQIAHVVNAVGSISQYETVYAKKPTEDSESLLIRVVRALESKSPSEQDSLFARDDYPAYKSLRAFLCHGLLNWSLDSKAREPANLDDNVVQLIEKLLQDALDQQTVKYWTATNEINKLEASLASALGTSQKADDEGEAEEKTAPLLEKLDRIRNEKKRFVEERVSAPSPILAYSKATELSSLLPDGSVKDSFAKILAETWIQATS